MKNLKPIRTEADYEAALAEIARLWSAPAGTPQGDRLDILATLVDASRTNTTPWTRLTRLKRLSSAWSSGV